VIEALTFDEMVARGRESSTNIVNGMPWSFEINGHAVSHENDDCYVITTLEGTHHMTRADMLIIGVKGEIYPCKLDIFEATYEGANTDPLAQVRAKLLETASKCLDSSQYYGSACAMLDVYQRLSWGCPVPAGIESSAAIEERLGKDQANGGG
jgi:hypothetical protein